MAEVGDNSEEQKTGLKAIPAPLALEMVPSSAVDVYTELARFSRDTATVYRDAFNAAWRAENRPLSVTFGSLVDHYRKQAKRFDALAAACRTT